MPSAEDIEKLDVIISGAGPSGSAAASILAQSGLSVLMLESKMEIGSPVICADSVNLSFEDLEVLKNDSRIFIRPLESLVIRATSNTKGFAMDASFSPGDAFNSVAERDRLDKELASRALINGSRLFMRSELTDFEVHDDSVGVSYARAGKVRKLKADYLILASGNLRDIPANTHGGSVTRLDYEYNRLLGNKPEKDEMHIGPGGAHVFKIPRHHNEWNSISAGTEMPESGFSRSEPDVKYRGNSIITGTARVHILSEPNVGEGRAIRVGSNSGLYDPLFRTGFREAYLSGRLAARSILESGGTQEKAIDLYSRKVSSQIIPGMSAGSKIRTLINQASRENLDKFIEYLSGFNFSEISAKEILKVTGLSDTELESMLGYGH